MNRTHFRFNFAENGVKRDQLLLKYPDYTHDPAPVGVLSSHGPAAHLLT